MTAPVDLEQDLALARELVEQACEIALPHFRRGPTPRAKADGTLVTDADVEVERHLVERLRAERPDDAVLGEELGSVGTSPRRWIIDPIDGTSNFVADRSDWGTHVALAIDGEVVLGAISRPALDLRWWARRGNGAYRGGAGASAHGERLRVSPTTELRGSRVAVWAEAGHPVEQRLAAAGAEPLACDLNAILELASGRLDAAIDQSGRPWDHAPVVVLVEEAGGCFSDRNGTHRIDLGQGRYSNAHIHTALCAALDAD